MVGILSIAGLVQAFLPFPITDSVYWGKVMLNSNYFLFLSLCLPQPGLLRICVSSTGTNGSLRPTSPNPDVTAESVGHWVCKQDGVGLNIDSIIWQLAGY